MGITAVNLDFVSEGASQSAGSDSQIDTSYTFQYRVEVDNESDSAATVLANTGLPGMYAPCPIDLTAFCVNRKASRESGTRKVWIVSVDYKTDAPNSEDQEDDPLDRPVKRSWSITKTTKVAAKDVKGDPILNKAGFAFDPPLEIAASHARLIFVRNEEDFDGTKALNYVDRVNKDAWAGADKGTVRCESIAADEQFENGVSYWTVTYEFEYNPEGWQPEILEQSIKDKNGKHIQDDDGLPVSSPWPINVNGVKIETANLPADAVYTEFEVYEEKNFSALNLL